MCVIFACEKTIPTSEELFSAEAINQDGGGIAWISKKDKAVFWKKGISAQEVLDMSKKLPLPLLIHFRVASVGPEVPALTHPFPLEPDVSLDLSGSTSKGVLMHNGTLSGWKSDLREAVQRSRLHIPGGEWSDTRAMAWLIANFGHGYVGLIQPSQKLAILHPTFGLWFGPADDWDQSEDKGFYFSNKGWMVTKKLKENHFFQRSTDKEDKQTGKTSPVGGSNLARVEDLIKELEKGEIRFIV